ncbi:60S ribosomal protein L27B [Xylographa soralifera]|nr:60S ribosomal protein L27B [Xylographa soralifera]
MKFLKVGRVAIITRGRYAGKKVVIIQPLDTGSKSHPFPHALVAGIERYPSPITRRMSKTRQTKRSKVKPFIKTINYNHLMPTRYTLELEGLKGVVTNDTFKEVSQREDAKKIVKKALEERYTSGKNRWFFTPLSGDLSKRWEDCVLTCARVLKELDSTDGYEFDMHVRALAR